MCFHEMLVPPLFRPSLTCCRAISIGTAALPKSHQILRARKLLLLLGLGLTNLVVKSPDTLVEVHLFERGLEVADHLPEVVEEAAELDEAEVDSAAKSFGKEAVPKEEPDADLRDWSIIGQLVLANTNESPRTKRLRHFGSQKLSWLTLQLGLGSF